MPIITKEVQLSVETRASIDAKVSEILDAGGQVQKGVLQQLDTNGKVKPIEDWDASGNWIVQIKYQG